MNLHFPSVIAAFLSTLAGLLLVCTVDARAAEGYQFAPVNQYGINLYAAYWNPILEHVSQTSGVKLSLKMGRTSAETTSYVLAKEVDFAFTNHLFSPERQKLGWRVFSRRKTPPLYSQLVVADDSPITNIAELAGLEVVFPGPEALVAYKMAYAHLLSRGVDVKVIFGGNMDGALAQLFSGRAKAAGVNSQLAEGFMQREKKTYRVLWRSGPVHDLALMVSPAVPAKDARAVADSFAGMARDPKGRAIIEQVSTLVKLPPDSVFIESDGSEYGVYLNFFKTAPAHLR